jgi:hypothetical protein
LKNYQHKKEGEKQTFNPKISIKSQMLAEQRRQKIFNTRGEKIDIVEILLHPANTTTSFSRMEKTRQESQLLQDKELTMMPKTLQKTNQRLL